MEEYDLNYEKSTQDPVAKEAFMSTYIPLINSIVWQLLKEKNYGAKEKEYFEDLYQAGWIGLLVAYNKYDRTKKAAFSTYAYFWIRKHVLMCRDELGMGIDLQTIPVGGQDDENSNEIPDESAIPEDTAVSSVYDFYLKSTIYKEMKTNLSDLEFQVITKSFGLDGNKKKTRSTIADEMGISMQYVAKLKKQALAKLAKNHVLKGEWR